MTPSIFHLLLVQLAIATLLWFLFFRKMLVPLGGKILTIVAYITVPAILAVKGTQSAIYLSDLVFPFLVYALLARRTDSRLLANHCFIWLMVLLVVFPIIFGVAYMLSQGGNIGLGARDIKGDIIWLYRNFTFLMLFGYGLRLNLSPAQFVEFVKMNLLLSLALAIMGLLNYFGPFNLAFFDQIDNKYAFEENFGDSRVGAGFMGLFRGSVGQWYAMIVVLGIGSYMFLSSVYRVVALLTVALGVGMILLSYSRAGLIGAGFGLALLALFGSGFKQRLAALGGIAVGVGWLILQPTTFIGRFSTIYTGKGEAGGRIGSWERTLEYFSNNQNALLMGVGPTNRNAIAEVAGTYGAHNEYLDVIYRFGITGVIVLLIVIGVLVFYFIKQRQEAQKNYVPLINTVISVLLINSVIGISQEHFLHDYASYTMGFFLYLFYGLAFGVTWNNQYLTSPVMAPHEILDVRLADIQDVRLKS